MTNESGPWMPTVLGMPEPLKIGRGTTECPHCGQWYPHNHTREWITRHSLTLAVDRLEQIRAEVAASPTQLIYALTKTYGLDGRQFFEAARRFERDLQFVLAEIGWRRDEEETPTPSHPSGDQS